MTESSHTAKDVAKHFTILVYPFRHSLSGSSGERAFHQLESRWAPWWSRHVTDDQLKTTIDDSYFLLTYVRRLFFPETQLLPEADVADQVTKARELSNHSLCELLDRFSQEHRDNMVLRLTLRETPLCEIRDLRFEAMDATASVKTHWVDALICPQGVGFLIWKVEISDPDLTHLSLSNLLYWLRLLHPLKAGWALPKWKALGGDMEFESRDLVDFLLQKMTHVDDKLDNSLEEFFAAEGQVVRGDLYSVSSSGQIYGHVFQMFSYVTLVDDEGDDGKDDDFPCKRDRWVYELATCTDTTDASYAPHAAAISDFTENNRIAYWRNWQGMSLHDTTVSVGFVTRSEITPREDGTLPREPFVMGVLPHNMESDYFQLYLLVLFQRTWLSLVFGELLREGPNVDKNWRGVHKIWRRFIQFENCFWYNEVTNKPQGIAIYQQFQRSLGVKQIYDELKDQLKTLHEHFDSAVVRRTSGLLNLLTLLGLPIGITMQIHGAKLAENPSEHWPVFASLFLRLVLAVLIGSVLWNWCWNWWNRR